MKTDTKGFLVGGYEKMWHVKDKDRASELGVFVMNDGILCIDASSGTMFHDMSVDEATEFLTKEGIVEELEITDDEELS